MKSYLLLLLLILANSFCFAQNVSTKADSCCTARNSLDVIKKEIIQLRSANDSLEHKLALLRLEKDSSEKEMRELSNQLQTLQQDIQYKSNLLHEKINLLEEKEKIFNQKEKIYKETIFNSKIDSVEFIGKINTQNALLEGKTEKISLLQIQINEKEKHINQKEKKLQDISQQHTQGLKKIDSLQNILSLRREKINKLQQDSIKKHMEIALLTKSKESYKKSLDNCQNADKKKKIRLVQGVAFKSYRTPKYDLSPKDVNNVSVYEIHNKNKGSFEVDYITGVSLKLLPIFTKKNEYANDIGAFIGFGGKDLFKNFYIGPNIKLLNAFHINAGINLREYEVLKEGFNEGDVLATGTSIPTDNEWKINWYAGLTFDFSLIADVAKKL